MNPFTQLHYGGFLEIGDPQVTIGFNPNMVLILDDLEVII